MANNSNNSFIFPKPDMMGAIRQFLTPQESVKAFDFNKKDCLIIEVSKEDNKGLSAHPDAYDLLHAASPVLKPSKQKVSSTKLPGNPSEKLSENSFIPAVRKNFSLRKPEKVQDRKFCLKFKNESETLTRNKMVLEKLKIPEEKEDLDFSTFPVLRLSDFQ